MMNERFLKNSYSAWLWLGLIATLMIGSATLPSATVAAPQKESAAQLLPDEISVAQAKDKKDQGAFLQQGKRVLKSHFQRQDSALRYRCNQIEGIQVDILLISSRVRVCREVRPRSNEET